MWGYGVGHGFLMVIGWLLGLLVLGGTVYIAVQLAMRRNVQQVTQAIEDELGVERRKKREK